MYLFTSGIYTYTCIIEHDDDDDDEDYVPRQKNLKTKLVDIPANITEQGEQAADMGLSERILIESASEKERVSEVNTHSLIIVYGWII